FIFCFFYFAELVMDSTAANKYIQSLPRGQTILYIMSWEVVLVCYLPFVFQERQGGTLFHRRCAGLNVFSQIKVFLIGCFIISRRVSRVRRGKEKQHCASE